jgi:hypothetical protein
LWKQLRRLLSSAENLEQNRNGGGLECDISGTILDIECSLGDGNFEVEIDVCLPIL